MANDTHSHPQIDGQVKSEFHSVIHPIPSKGITILHTTF